MVYVYNVDIFSGLYDEFTASRNFWQFFILHYSLNSKIRRNISFQYNAFSEKNALFLNRIIFEFSFRIYMRRCFLGFDYNASPYFRFKTVDISCHPILSEQWIFWDGSQPKKLGLVHSKIIQFSKFAQKVFFISIGTLIGNHWLKRKKLFASIKNPVKKGWTLKPKSRLKTVIELSNFFFQKRKTTKLTKSFFNHRTKESFWMKTVQTHKIA